MFVVAKVDDGFLVQVVHLEDRIKVFKTLADGLDVLHVADTQRRCAVGEFACARRRKLCRFERKLDLLESHIAIDYDGGYFQLAVGPIRDTKVFACREAMVDDGSYREVNVSLEFMKKRRGDSAPLVGKTNAIVAGFSFK